MKRFLMLLGLIFCLLISNKCFADVIPRYTDSIRFTGIGAFNTPQEFEIYAEPDETSPILKSVKWDSNGLINDKTKENDIFAVFIPSQNIAYCTVDEEIDGWVKIYYSQALGKSGWVKTTPKNRYVSWLGFYMSWGRKNGVYFFKDMPEINKRLMSNPDPNSQKVWGITYARYTKLTLIRGNWMMVKLLDFGNEIKIGWMQWRDENGKFMIFPIMQR